MPCSTLFFLSPPSFSTLFLFRGSWSCRCLWWRWFCWNYKNKSHVNNGVNLQFFYLSSVTKNFHFFKGINYFFLYTYNYLYIKKEVKCFWKNISLSVHTKTILSPMQITNINFYDFVIGFRNCSDSIVLFVFP